MWDNKNKTKKINRLNLRTKYLAYSNNNIRIKGINPERVHCTLWQRYIFGNAYKRT